MQTYIKLGITMLPELRYTISEAANLLGVHPDTVRRWESTGKIKSIRVSGGWRRFPESEIKRILEGEQ